MEHYDGLNEHELLHVFWAEVVASAQPCYVAHMAPEFLYDAGGLDK